MRKEVQRLKELFFLKKIVCQLHGNRFEKLEEMEDFLSKYKVLKLV